MTTPPAHLVPSAPPTPAHATATGLAGWPEAALLSALIDLGDAAVVVVGGDGVVAQAAGAAEAVFGLPASALTGRPFDDALWRALDETGRPLPADRLPVAIIRRSGRVVGGMRQIVCCPDGGHRLLGVTGRPLPGRDAGGAEDGAVMLAIRDLTAQQRSEANARAARQAKHRFLSALSHELRTPLNAVIGFSDLLLSTAAGRLNERERTSLADVLAAGLRLLDSVNAMLDLAAVESGRFALAVAPVPLAPLLADLAEAAAAQAAAAGVRVEVASLLADGLDEAAAVFADGGRLRQVLDHLLANALRFAEPGGQVEVLATEGLQPGLVRLAVRDDGPGIPEALRPDLFEPFAALHLADPRVAPVPQAATGGSGLGIGLTLCRHLVEAMNGRIGVDSAPGAGSLFWIELPRAETAPGGGALW